MSDEIQDGKGFEKVMAITGGIAPNNPYQPDDDAQARLRHKTILMVPRNPDHIFKYIQNSSLSPDAKLKLGSLAKEDEAPERILAMFDKETAERKAWGKKYRVFKTSLYMDKLDTRNSDYHYVKDALEDNIDYQLSRTNTANGPSERILQDTDLTNNVTTARYEEVPQTKKRGILSWLGRR